MSAGKKISVIARLADLPATRLAGARGDPLQGARQLSTPVWVFDIDNSKILFANQSACNIWQAASEAELQARDMSEGMSPAISKRLQQYKSDFIQRDATFCENWTLYPNGLPTNMNVVFRGFRLADGRMCMLCEASGNIGAQPENLRSAEALLHTDVNIAQFDASGPVLYLNPSARQVFGRPSKGLGGLFAKKADHDTMKFELDRRGEHRMIAQVHTRDGIRWFDISAKKCSDAVTGRPAILLTATDVSELKNARDQAHFLAERDQLTGVFNRSFLIDKLNELSKSSDVICALIYFDLDRFKNVNDSFGHETGDHVLKKIAKRALATVDETDFVVRLGGDEFAILLVRDEDGHDFGPVVSSVFNGLAGPITSGLNTIEMHVSMGVTLFPPACLDFVGALRQADIALYHSKRQGRNQFTFYSDEIGEAALARAQFEKEIQSALTNDEFLLHFQPRLDVASERIVSAEALVRWNHPERGLLSPGAFVPLCEETGLIEQLGQKVLDLAFKQAFAWWDAGHDIQMSINISPRQFTDPAFMFELRAFSEAEKFRPNMIELEITETVLIGDLDVIAAQLEEISSLGYRVAIDDFGTGYSNLSYISKLAVDCIKIDSSFVWQLPETGPIVKLVLALAEQLGATVVAEGVETKSQLAWLQKQNCDQVQGFLVAEPLEPGDVLALLDKSLPDLQDAAQKVPPTAQ